MEKFWLNKGVVIKNLLIILIFSITVLGQTASNLDIMMGFADSSTISCQEYLSKDNILFIDYQSGLNESVFLNRLLIKLNERGVKIISDKTSAEKTLYYFVSDAGVEYTNVIKEGLFDDYLVERKTHFSGSFVLSDKKEVLKTEEFHFAKSDTIRYNEIQQAENVSLNFTCAELPEEPFWVSLIEPAVAVCAIIVTVILLFTVRSK